MNQLFSIFQVMCGHVFMVDISLRYLQAYEDKDVTWLSLFVPVCDYSSVHVLEQ